MKRWSSLLAPLCLLACSDTSLSPRAEVFIFDFADGAQGWAGDFADYPVGEDEFYELVADYRELPDEVGSDSALFISGNNHSDDLFMFYKRRVEGLEPNTAYQVRFEVEIATEAGQDCVGIGGAPGEGVTLKAGATTIEPLPVENDGSYEMNVDKGNQVQPGADALVLGNIANTRSCDEEAQFELKSLSSGNAALEVTADANGRAWVFVGTDSGFEGTTNLYYTRFTAEFDR